MRYGPNAATLTILRRGTDADGNATGPFAPVIATWCRWTQNAGAMAAVNGQREDAIDVLASVNDNPGNRTISNGDRALLRDASYEIVSAALPERKSGSIALMLKRVTNA